LRPFCLHNFEEKVAKDGHDLGASSTAVAGDFSQGFPDFLSKADVPRHFMALPRSLTAAALF
jgi:hypothetical protein